MNFVDKGLSVDNGCFRYQSLFLRHKPKERCMDFGKSVKFAV